MTTCVVLSKGGSRDVKAGSLFIHRGGMATSLRGMGIHKRLLSKSIPKSINPTFSTIIHKMDWVENGDAHHMSVFLGNMMIHND